MATQKWLKDYFGKDFDLLSPSVVADGDTKAVVKLSRKAAKGYSGTGYVLVEKSGKHNVTEHIVLHEGLASKEDMDTMKHVLAQKDGK